MSTKPPRLIVEPAFLDNLITHPVEPRTREIIDAFKAGYAEASPFAILAAQDILYTRHFGTEGNDAMTGTAAHEVFHLQQGGEDVIDGGAGDDGFYFGANWSAGDKVDGGAGNDQLGLKGNYGQLGFGIDAMRGIETLVLLSGQQTDYGTSGNEYYSYRIKTHDNNVGGGERPIRRTRPSPRVAACSG